MDVADGKLGEVGAWEVDLSSGSLVLKAKVAAKAGEVASLGVNVEASVSGDALIDAICKAIPGHVDDALGGVLKSALKALSVPKPE